MRLARWGMSPCSWICSRDGRRQSPMEDFYDGYIVNAIIDACYKAADSEKWEAVEIADWRGGEAADDGKDKFNSYDEDNYLIKEERMPSGQLKLILKNKKTGTISQIVKE